MRIARPCVQCIYDVVNRTPYPILHHLCGFPSPLSAPTQFILEFRNDMRITIMGLAGPRVYPDAGFSLIIIAKIVTCSVTLFAINNY